MLMQRLIAASCLLFIVSLFLSPRADAQDKMRLGLSSVSALHSAVWIAEQKGLFRKHGIDAEVIVTGQGGITGVSALIANDIQVVNSAGDVLVASTLRGADTVMIASVVNKGLQRLITKPEITPLLAAARAAGCQTLGGLAMLEAQADTFLEFFGVERYPRSAEDPRS